MKALAWTYEPVVPPGGYFGIIANRTARRSLEMLAEHGPLDHAEHMDRICKACYVSKSTFDRIHRELVESDLIACLPSASNRSRRVDSLCPLTRELLQLAAEVGAVECWAPPGLRDANATPLLNAIADQRGWLIVRELFDGPFPYRELSTRLPGLAEGTLNDALRRLAAAGLLRADDGLGQKRQRCYALTELVPALTRVTLLAARFRRRITPRSAPWLTGDLPSFIRMLERAPAPHLPQRHLRGTILLEVVKPACEERGWPAIEVALRHGRLVAHRLDTRGPTATARALPEAWCDAALDGDLSGIEIAGDQALAHASLDAVVAIVAACPQP